MADIFISYKREDQEEHGRVRPIADALRAEGYDVFYDVQVPPGSKWEDVLKDKIGQARAVLVLWSDASVRSDWVKEEAEMAKAAGKLIPVLLDPVDPPFGFARIESANLADWNGDLGNTEWKNLVAAVKARIGAGERDTQPGVSAVNYPAKQVTVTKHASAPPRKRRSMAGVLIGAAALAVVAGGLFALQMTGDVDQSPARAPSEAVASDVASTAIDTAVTATPPAPTPQPESNTAAEDAFAEARRLNTPEAYEAFARRYRTHRFAEGALQRARTLRAQAAETNYDRISERTFRIAGVTINDVTLTPKPGTTIVEGERITVTFDYRLGTIDRARIWARPVLDGSGPCRAGSSGSPLLSASGSGEQWFSFSGGGCASRTITGLRLSVRPNEDQDRADDAVIPIRYSFR
ncbi:MAG: toll/interleukin-1 receptor domain-containing protein [Pseudomonadota bacterium]